MVPLYKPYFGREEKAAVLKVLKSSTLSKGKEAESFEKLFAKYVGKKYAVSTNSGTSGLHLAIKALGLKRGDEVITTPYSFISSSNVLLYEGIIPVFADIDPLTYNLSPRNAVKKISSKTKAILIVDLFGYPCSKEFKKISQKYHIPILEDACEAFGKPTKKFTVGIGDVAVYGLSENKPITSAGEGGMIVTDNKKIKEYCIAARDQGRSNKKNWLNNVIMGYSYRMTEVQAAFGKAQLKKIDNMLKEREKLVLMYNKHLAGNRDLTLPYASSLTRRSWFTYFITLSSKRLYEKVCKKLKNKKIAFHNYFIPIHLFPEYKKFGYRKGDFPVSEKISATTIALPFYIGLTNLDIKYISKAIRSAIE